MPVTASDDSLSTSSVAITVKSDLQQASHLQAQVDDFAAAGVLNSRQSNSLDAELSLHGNAGDASRVRAFLNAGIPT